MKKITQSTLLFIFSIVGFIPLHVFAQPTLVEDSVIMGSGYVNEVYYSMANGTVGTVPRDQWDIAFRATVMSSSIITNDGTGVILYTYPKSDTSGWATVDTSGLSGWVPMYNDPDDWENGAFSRNSTGHPDYGWGIYNSTTHNLKGDSLFIIKLRNESFRKVWIERKFSSLNTYIFKYAFLDGSDEHEITLDCNPFSAKEFVGYNLAMNVIVDFQPPKSDWDLLFTKYMSVQPNGTPYPVTGVLSGINVGVGEYRQVDPEFSDWSTLGFGYFRSMIGYDWKVFDMGTFTYKCVDSLIYFVQDQPGDVYELIFKKFDMTTGKAVFGKTRVSMVGMEQTESTAGTPMIYPNPATDCFNINFNNPHTKSLSIRITDMLGKMVYRQDFSDVQPGFGFSVPVNQWERGLYIINVNADNYTSSEKLIVR